MLRLKVLILSLLVGAIWGLQIAFFALSGFWLLSLNDFLIASLLEFGPLGFIGDSSPLEPRPLGFLFGASWTLVFAIACLLARGATHGGDSRFKWLLGLIVATTASLWLFGYNMAATGFNLHVKGKWIGLPQMPLVIALVGVIGAFVVIPLQVRLARYWRRLSRQSADFDLQEASPRLSLGQAVGKIIRVALVAAFAVRSCVPFEYIEMDSSHLIFVCLIALASMLLSELIVAGWLIPLAVKKKRYSFALTAICLAIFVGFAYPLVTARELKDYGQEFVELRVLRLINFVGFSTLGFVLLLIANRIPLEWLLEARREQRNRKTSALQSDDSGLVFHGNSSPVTLGHRYWSTLSQFGLIGLMLLSVWPVYRDPLVAGNSLFASNPETVMTALNRGWETQKIRAVDRIEALVESKAESMGGARELKAKWTQRFEEVLAKSDLSEETAIVLAIAIGKWSNDVGPLLDEYLSLPQSKSTVLRTVFIFCRPDVDEQIWPRIAQLLNGPHSTISACARGWLFDRRTDPRCLEIVKEIRVSDLSWDSARLVVWGLQAPDLEVQEVLAELTVVTDTAPANRTAENLEANERIRAIARGYIESGRQELREQMVKLWIESMLWEYRGINSVFHLSLDPIVLQLAKGNVSWQDLEPYHDELLAKVASSLSGGNEIDCRRAAYLLSLGCGSIEELQQHGTGARDVTAFEAQLERVESYAEDGETPEYFGSSWEQTVAWP